MASEFLTNEVISAFNEKLTVREISAKLGCSEYIVRSVLKNAGVQVNVKKTRELERAELIKNLCEKEKLTTQEISKKLELSEAIIRSVVKKFGLENLIKDRVYTAEIITEENAEKVRKLTYLTKSEVARVLGISPTNVNNICKRYNIKFAHSSCNQTSTLCWGCANAYSGCSWSRDFKPVDGWDAKKTKIETHNRGYTDSYIVYKCPMFKEG